MRMSESMKRVLLAMALRLYVVACRKRFGRRCRGPLIERRKRRDVECRGLVREHLRCQRARIRRLESRWRLDGPERRRANGKNEFLHSAVAIPDLPRDGALLRFPKHSDLVAKRGEVRIASNVDRVLWACLHARVAL